MSQVLFFGCTLRQGSKRAEAIAKGDVKTLHWTTTDWTERIVTRISSASSLRDAAPPASLPQTPASSERKMCLLAVTNSHKPRIENTMPSIFPIDHVGRVEDDITAVSYGVAMTTSYIERVLSAVANKAPGIRVEPVATVPCKENAPSKYHADTICLAKSRVLQLFQSVV